MNNLKRLTYMIENINFTTTIKSYSIYDLYIKDRQTRKSLRQSQNSIIKLLDCIDSNIDNSITS